MYQYNYKVYIQNWISGNILSWFGNGKKDHRLGSVEN